eukprot:20715-Alexandrium_andersonii.AAC.1
MAALRRRIAIAQRRMSGPTLGGLSPYLQCSRPAFMSAGARSARCTQTPAGCRLLNARRPS